MFIMHAKQVFALCLIICFLKQTVSTLTEEQKRLQARENAIREEIMKRNNQGNLPLKDKIEYITETINRSLVVDKKDVTDDKPQTNQPMAPVSAVNAATYNTNLEKIMKRNNQGNLPLKDKIEYIIETINRDLLGNQSKTDVHDHATASVSADTAATDDAKKDHNKE
ncbi:uncharacterized protein LOC126836859 [Adelges cooleyi]|uniref:uncharacterized protein LOC126836859 n=1 Tax=Adelges cooleyi TaxID=133065 RepID=UPI00218090DF|nr:uncharacterized protein LOC126836859 [Adelges cooleyi]